ncbi:MAG TPA: endonuclease/exonuclease/phosphatase family protein [Flavobacteriales bacterium]|mgnify:CR=1 FL=1|nr:endonuclease/exonuclease/phosphatase family protein [Flavobacteriales bacterium]
MGNEPSSPGSKRRVSRWHQPLWWLNGLAVAGLLLAYLSTWVRPATFWPLAFFGMAYPYLLAANLLCVGWWLLFRRKRMLPSLLAILLGWGFLGQYVRLFGHHGQPAGVRTPFTLMSWNVRLFNLYNWTHNQQTRDEIMDLIRLEDPDILCLQEFLNVGQGNPLMVKDSLLAHYRYTHCADAYTAHARLEHSMGIALFSTWPILAHDTIQFQGERDNICLWADIAVGLDTIRVYTAHISSIRFGDDDYAFVRNLAHGTVQDSATVAGTRIVNRLKRAFIRRSAQVDRMISHMRQSPWPVVYCGDLNDTPMSYSFHELLRSGLTDAFEESGRGFGGTYIGDAPNFRIDHILHGRRFRSWNFRTLPDELSDHRAIITSMGLVDR